MRRGRTCSLEACPCCSVVAQPNHGATTTYAICANVGQSTCTVFGHSATRRLQLPDHRAGCPRIEQKPARFAGTVRDLRARRRASTRHRRSRPRSLGTARRRRVPDRTDETVCVSARRVSSLAAAVAGLLAMTHETDRLHLHGQPRSWCVRDLRRYRSGTELNHGEGRGLGAHSTAQTGARRRSGPLPFLPSILPRPRAAHGERDRSPVSTVAAAATERLVRFTCLAADRSEASEHTSTRTAAATSVVAATGAAGTAIRAGRALITADVTRLDALVPAPHLA